MKRHLFGIVLSLTVAGCILSSSNQVFAQEKKPAEQEKKPEKTPPAGQKGGSPAFLDTWKQIQGAVNKKRASKTQQGVETAGVRGAEAEDQLIANMYYKGGTAYPGAGKIETTIQMLTKMVEDAKAADPASAAEPQFYIGQCYSEINKKDKAIAAFDEVIKLAPKSDWATKARDEKKRLSGK